MKNRNRNFKNLLENILFFPLSFLVRCLPRKGALFVGAGFGRVLGCLMSAKRRIAVKNMGQAFPELSETELQQRVDAMFVHIGKSVIEMLRLDLFTDADVDEIFIPTGLENLREAYDYNRGVILLSGHVGFWEVGTFLLPKLGFPADFVAKKMKNPQADKYITRMREAAGGRCIDSKSGARRILRSLSENRGVAVLIDQHRSTREGVAVPFFGRPASTTPIIARLAMKYQIPVVPIFSYRRSDNRYDFQAQPMLFLQDAPGASVEENTALLTAIIEEAIRKDVTQWLWLHRRWR
jgi:KDO2-lipid IV(A) lauroyltransferase